MKIYCLIAIFFLFGNGSLFAQEGNPFIRNIPPSAYQSDAYISSPQNWAIMQDNRGIIYFSNTSGMLEYDGINWRNVEGTENEGIFRLTKTKKGKLYTGGGGQMGYLAPDTVGKMRFFSLLPHLKGKYPDLRVTSTASIGENAYFCTKNDLFRWSGKQFKVWNSKAGFTRIFASQDQLYVLDKEKGLCTLKDDQLTPLPAGQEFLPLKVTALIPLAAAPASNLKMLVVTFDSGLYLYQDQTLQKLSTSPAGVLDEAYFMHGLKLQDGSIALASTTHGVVIINDQGQIKKVFDKEAGLQDNTVLFLYTDREGGLWAGLNSGISRIEYPSPLTYFSETSGLEGRVYTILKKRGRLYAGTTSGLFVLNEEDVLPTFKKISQLNGEVWHMLDVGNSVVVANTFGAYLLTDKGIRKISPDTEEVTFKVVHQSREEPNRVFLGCSAGLAVLTRQDGKWKWEGKVKGLEHEVIWLAEDKEGFLWASNFEKISSLDISPEYGLTPPVYSLDPSENLAKDLYQLQVQALNGNIYFGTSKGIYSFQKQGKHHQLKPDATFGFPFASGTREAINMTQDNKGRIWLTSEFRTGQLRKLRNKAYVWDTIPLSRMPRVDVWTIYTDPEDVVWLGTEKGIFRYNPHIPEEYSTRQRTVLRKVKLQQDSTVFHGAFSNNGTATTEQSPQYKFTLPHAIRSISFEYAATSFDAPEQIMYSYMLDGEDEGWSHWTTETKKEYTGLDEGDYVFKVRSKNVYGAISPVSAFEFTSLPPFYRTWWAYTFYAIVYGFIIWGGIKIKHRNLIASKKSLEKQVQERTAQLEEEKKKSDDLLLNILPAATAEELKANGRTVARSYKAATVLFTDFKDFTKISQDLSPEELVAVIDFYFCAFDRIIAKYNIEKIKTIGDAYMCAGGIPDPEANTPADVVKAGLEILSFVESLNPDHQLKKHKFEIRIGIHTGPVVAGVVGTQKFAYDIWGDTVNTAARMESSGQEGKVNISGATYDLIKDEFICTYRGKVDAKNKGEIDMYFVEAIVPNPVLV